MGTTVRQALLQKIFIALLVITVGVIISPIASSDTAYAADEGAPLQAQSLTTTSTIPSAPYNKLSMYEVYSTYFFFNPGAFKYMDARLCMEIRPVGGAWKTYTGMMYYQTYEFTGLSPNKWHEVRLYYKHNWSGDTSNYSPIVKFRTGPNKKPAVKSAKVKAIKVKKRRATYYGYYTGLPLGKYTYYTYKLRTTVKFKKAPKTKFMVVNGKYFKCNKKKKTFTVTTKKLTRYYNTPRGKKYKVSVYSAQSKTWGGFSKLYQVNRKIK